LNIDFENEYCNTKFFSMFENMYSHSDT